MKSYCRQYSLRALVTVSAVLLLVFAAPAVARAGETNRADRLQAFVPPGLLKAASADENKTFRVIVTAARGKTARDLETAELRDRNGRSYGGVKRKFRVIDAVAVDLEGREILELVKKQSIRSIVPDALVAPTSFSPVELWPGVVGVDTLWETAGPSGPVSGPQAPAIAIVDSGVDSTRVADFGGRVLTQVNFASGSSLDANGHGTLVAGVAAGSASAYPGAAPNANIVSLRVVGEDGSGRTSDVIAAADWIYLNRIAYGIGVANFSLHSANPAYALEDPLALAARRLWLTGTVVVAAAGNEGPQRMLYAPASDPFVITVGAVGTNGTAATADDTNAPWSSYGYTAEGFAKPELSAPGRYIVGPLAAGSTIAANFGDRVVAPGYVWMSGTSFAAPIVSGAAAQILARHPAWSPDQVKGALMLTARHLPEATAMSSGVGEIDAAAAAAAANPPNPHEHLDDFVATDPTTGQPAFDAAAWRDAVEADATWTSATWTSATWTSATWTSATWTSATWVSSAFADATWVSATWVSSTDADATWTSATWVSAHSIE